LSLIGCKVRGRGAAGGLMFGEIHALFYRYKSVGGFDYVAHFFICPRKPARNGKSAKGRKIAPQHNKHPHTLATLPGDSGTLWLLEPLHTPSTKRKPSDAKTDSAPSPYLPLAVQWGEQLLSSGGAAALPYVLATCLSTVCNLLDVDPVRDWNLDQPDTWGAVGHFSIASRVVDALSDRFPKLVKLMTNNAPLIAPSDQKIKTSDFKGMGSEHFVHLADVPDFFWKHGQQGFSRHFEGPNHFADMD